MSNQQGRQSLKKYPQTLLLWIIIIGIIGYLLLPNFSETTPPIMDSRLDNANQPRTNDPNPLNSSDFPIPNSTSVNDTLNSAIGNDKLSNGYWILFVSNDAVQQFFANAQVYAFLKELINSDSKGTPKITVFLIDNGKINQHVVSNEIYSVISHLIAIESRASNTSNSTLDASPNPIPDSSPAPFPNGAPDSTPNVTPNSTPNTSPDPIPNVSQ